MLRFITGNQNHVVDVNSRMSLIAAIYLGLIGVAVFIVQPGFVQGLVEHYGFGEQEAGYVAAAEMWGIAITTLIMTFFSSRINWRNVLTYATLIMVAGNLLSTLAETVVSFGILRAITGIGSGALISLTFTIVGLTSNPDRNFGYMIMWVLVYGAIGFMLMPTAYSLFGMDGVLVFFALFSLSALPFIRFLPTSGEEHMVSDDNSIDLPKKYKVLAVGTMFVYFVAQGVVWAYLFLIGTSGGGTEQQVANGLTLSQFFGIAGAFLAAMLSSRFGRISPLSIGITGSVISLMFLFGKMGPLIYGFAVCLFNFAWNMTHPFLLAAMASFDRSGRLVINAVAAQMMGLAIGPALAASVIAKDEYSNVVWLGMGLFVVSLLTIIPPLLRQKNAMQTS